MSSSTIPVLPTEPGSHCSRDKSFYGGGERGSSDYPEWVKSGS